MKIPTMRELAPKIRSILSLEKHMDKIGILLSLFCIIHCLITPFLLMSLPIMARYYVLHPSFHWVLAFLIVPVGFLAFYQGYKHHQKKSVFYLGIPGLIIVGVLPVFFHRYLGSSYEPVIITIGSILIITAHWINRRSCSCEIHRS
jgi:CDP-diglyceride synthetase